jgi:hypothetical protein
MPPRAGNCFVVRTDVELIYVDDTRNPPYAMLEYVGDGSHDFIFNIWPANVDDALSLIDDSSRVFDSFNDHGLDVVDVSDGSSIEIELTYDPMKRVRFLKEELLLISSWFRDGAHETKSDVGTQRKRDGLCPVCGDRGQWIMMGLFCTKGHGQYAG